MTAYRQEPPFAIQIEPTEGCTLACSFCALQSIRDNGANAEEGKHGKNSPPYRFMTSELALHIAAEIARLKWNPRIEFAMHGEPTVNPKLPLIISNFRKCLPKASIMVTTNGSGVMSQERVLALFKAGLNTLAVDNYQHADFVLRMRQNKCFDPTWLREHDIKAMGYPFNKDANPHSRYKGKRIVVIRDITTNTNGTHKLTNQGGNSFGARPTLFERCAKPFRELSIRWDGNVALCCDDWKGSYKIGSVWDMELDELWNHERFVAARRALYHKQRQLIDVCRGCNVRTYRNGLLPDKKGKLYMTKPGKKEFEQIYSATKGKVFSLKLVK